MLAAAVDLDPLSSGDVVTIASVIVAAIGVVFAARYAKRQVTIALDQLQSAREQLEQQSHQLKQQSQTTRGQFLLAIHERFREHDSIHLRLRNAPPDYRWWSGSEPSGKEWAEVEAYMGLFERVWVLVKASSIDIEVIERLYGYRVENLVINDRIREDKLLDEEIAQYWIDFIELWRELDRAHGLRFGDTPVCRGHRAPATPYPFSAADSARSGVVS